MSVKRDKYILGQSESKELKELAEEIQLDLALTPNPNLEGGTILGAVKDEADNPISDALIKIMDNQHTPLAHAISGADGSYIFTAFPAGSDYHIFATATGYKLAENLPFTLLPQQEVTENFTLVPDPSTSLGVIAGDVLKTTVHTPINGAAVNLFSVDGGGTETLTALSFTNEYGQFVFSEVAKGSYIIRISALGYESLAQTIKIDKDSQIANLVVDLVVDPDASRGTISGIIADNDNKSIAGADVILYNIEDDESLTPIAYTKTNDEGVYLFINVTQGNYKIKANETIIDV